MDLGMWQKNTKGKISGVKSMSNQIIYKYIHMFALAVLAGIAIGIGGVVYLTLENKTVGALLFTIGLYTICVHGLNLFTGKAGYLVVQPVSYLLHLLIIWCGNLAGTALTAFAIRQTRIAEISQTAGTICQAKQNDSLLSLFILAIFCGFLMYISVDGYKSTQNPIILFLGVATFILCGFEHCIADMFYFSAAGIWSVQSFYRIVIISFGNVAGSILIPLFKKIPR